MAGFDLQPRGHRTGFGGRKELNVGEKELVDGAIRFHSRPYFLYILESFGLLLLCSVWHLVTADFAKVIGLYVVTTEFFEDEVGSD